MAKCKRTHVTDPFQHVLEDCYRIIRPYEIRAQLRALMRDRTLISVTFNNGKEGLLSMVVDMHDKPDLLLLDFGANTEITRRAIESGRLVCMAKSDGVPIRFVCESPRSVRYKGALTIASTIPQKMLRLQRRESFRAATPTTNGPSCLIPDPHSGEQFEMALHDISLGGVGLIDEHEEVRLEPSIIYSGSTLRLPEFGEIVTDLSIRYHLSRGGRNGASIHQYGAAFGKLSPGNTVLLQRYILYLQQMALRSAVS